MSNIFALNLKDIGGAVLSAVIIAVLAYLGNLSSIWNADLSAIINIAVLTGITSLLKALGTDNAGKFGGLIQIK